MRLPIVNEFVNSILAKSFVTNNHHHQSFTWFAAGTFALLSLAVYAVFIIAGCGFGREKSSSDTTVASDSDAKPKSNSPAKLLKRTDSQMTKNGKINVKSRSTRLPKLKKPHSKDAPPIVTSGTAAVVPTGITGVTGTASPGVNAGISGAAAACGRAGNPNIDGSQMTSKSGKTGHLFSNTSDSVIAAHDSTNTYVRVEPCKTQDFLDDNMVSVIPAPDEDPGL